VGIALLVEMPDALVARPLENSIYQLYYTSTRKQLVVVMLQKKPGLLIDLIEVSFDSLMLALFL